MLARRMSGRCGVDRELEGMVTNLQSEISLPGYYSMQDSQGDANSWSSYYHDKKLSEHIYNSFTLRLVNGYSEHDKEMLKRAMLEHEAIFRKQVCELHRLYRIQKELMYEFPKRGFCTSSAQAEGSLANSFTSQRQSELTERISRISSLSVRNTSRISYGNMSFAGMERLEYRPLSNGASPKDTEALNYKPQQRRTFDLQLPADVYINTEETDVSRQMNISEPSNSASVLKNGTRSLYSENDMKLSLGRDHEVEYQLSNSATQISTSARDSVHLKKPSTETSSDSPVYWASDNLLALKCHSERNQGHHSSMKSNATFMDRHGDQNVLNKNVYPEGEWPLFNPESGRETVPIKANTGHESFRSDHNHQERWSRQKSTHEIQAPPRSPHASSNSALISPSMPNTIIGPQTHLTRHASPMPIAVHTRPCFFGTPNLSNECLSTKRESQSCVTYSQNRQSRTLTPNQRIGIIASRATVFHHDLHLDSNSSADPQVALCKLDQIDHSKGNLHGHGSCFCGIEERLTFRQNPVYYGNAYDKVPDNSSWPNKASCSESAHLKKTATADFSFSNEHPKLILSSNIVAPEVERKEEKELGFSPCNLQEVALNSQIRYIRVQGNEVPDNNGNKVFAFPIKNMNKQSSLSKLTENDDRNLAVLCCDSKMSNSLRKTDDSESCGAKSSASHRKLINLNAEFTYADDSTPPKIVPPCEVLVPSSHSITIFGAKIASSSVLEAPNSQAGINIADQQKITSSSNEDDPKKEEHIFDTLVGVAADNLVAISKDDYVYKSERGSHILSLPRFETLVWFSEIVSCSSDNPTKVGKGNSGEEYTRYPHVDGFDIFEAMTLKLKEVKVDEYDCSGKELEGKDYKEHAGAASLLYAKPRRGQSRKKRQKRDFQKDILPGLASLSRQQVAEDLQTIGEMMRAAGRPCHTVLTRNKASRNGANSQTKGKRNTGSFTTVEEVQVTPRQPSLHSNLEIGWGRTTRRCRRQRCLPASLFTPVT